MRACSSTNLSVLLEKYMYGVRKSKSWLSLSLGLVEVFVLGIYLFGNESLFFYQSVCAVREASFQHNAFKVRA